MAEIYLIRHAHAEWNTDEMRPLSDRGLREAQAVADCLEQVGAEAVYSSPYRRARQTVEPLAARIGRSIVELQDLRERQLCEGAVADFDAATRATWDDFDFAHPGGETNRDAQRRGVALIRDLMAQHTNAPIVVSTHGTLLVLILNSFDPNIGFGFWSEMSFPDIYLLTQRNDGRESSVRRIWTGG